MINDLSAHQKLSIALTRKAAVFFDHFSNGHNYYTCTCHVLRMPLSLCQFRRFIGDVIGHPRDSNLEQIIYVNQLENVYFLSTNIFRWMVDRSGLPWLVVVFVVVAAAAPAWSARWFCLFLFRMCWISLVIRTVTPISKHVIIHSIRPRLFSSGIMCLNNTPCQHYNRWWWVPCGWVCLW